jgi:hypothetical protein
MERCSARARARTIRAGRLVRTAGVEWASDRTHASHMHAYALHTRREHALHHAAFALASHMPSHTLRTLFAQQRPSSPYVTQREPTRTPRTPAPLSRALAMPHTDVEYLGGPHRDRFSWDPLTLLVAVRGAARVPAVNVSDATRGHPQIDRQGRNVWIHGPHSALPPTAHSLPSAH